MAEVDKYAKLKALMDSWQNPIGDMSDEGWLARMGGGIYGSDATKNYVYNQMAKLPSDMWTPDTLKTVTSSLSEGASTPFSTKAGLKIPYTVDGKEHVLKSTPLKDTLGIAGANIGAHPGAAFGTAANIGVNLSGLFDNDKFGGQLIGGALGGLIPHLANVGLGPLGMVNAVGIGGALGSLFDKLREKKAQEQAMSQTYVRR